jgi:hypothetical protein
MLQMAHDFAPLFTLLLIHDHALSATRSHGFGSMPRDPMAHLVGLMLPSMNETPFPLCGVYCSHLSIPAVGAWGLTYT